MFSSVLPHSEGVPPDNPTTAAQHNYGTRTNTKSLIKKFLQQWTFNLITKILIETKISSQLERYFSYKVKGPLVQWKHTISSLGPSCCW